MKAKGVFAGYLLGVLTIFGCASAGIFPWPYYAAHMPDDCYEKGILYGKEGASGWPDLTLSTCQPDPVSSPIAGASPTPAPNLLKCITMKVDDFYSVKTAYLQCQSDLKNCQAANP